MPNNPNHPGGVKVGKKLHEGMKVFVVDGGSNETTGPGGIKVVSRVIKPAEFGHDGKMTKVAKVEVSIYDNMEQAKELLDKKYESIKERVQRHRDKTNAKYEKQLRELEAKYATPVVSATNEQVGGVEIEKADEFTSTIEGPPSALVSDAELRNKSIDDELIRVRNEWSAAISNAEKASKNTLMEAKDHPSDATYFGGRSGSELLDEMPKGKSAKFALFNIDGDIAEFSPTGRGVNEDYYEGVADIYGFGSGDLYTLDFGKARKINGK